MSKILFAGICALLVSATLAATCTSPTIESTSFTTNDATIVSQIGFIAEFSVKCSEANVESVQLFAEVDGKLSPVVRISSNEYQVSWTEDTKKARRGDRLVRLFDEDGFAAVRKAVRSNGNIESITPFATVTLYYPGAFNGPWVNSEILAAGIAVIVAYVAFSTRTKLLS